MRCMRGCMCVCVVVNVVGVRVCSVGVEVVMESVCEYTYLYYSNTLHSIERCNTMPRDDVDGVWMVSGATTGDARGYE